MIHVSFEDAPLPGATVTVSRSEAEGESPIVFSGPTGQDGALRLPHLKPGQYWLSVEYLGISAADNCFHVSAQPSWTAKRHLKLEWGNWGVTTQNITGELRSFHHKTGRTPIAHAEITLTNARSGETQTVSTAADGTFGFEHAAPQGTYVLRLFDAPAASMIIRRTAGASVEQPSLLLTDHCGPALQIDDQRSFTR